MNLALTPGRIRCDDDSVMVVHDEPHFKVIEVDLDSKYPGEVDWDVDSDKVRFMILAGPDTLRTDETATRNTTLTVSIPNEDLRRWRVFSRAARYTWEIVMWKRDIDY